MIFFDYFRKCKYDTWLEHIVMKLLMPSLLLVLLAIIIYAICTGQEVSSDYTPVPVIIDGNVYIM
jgi:uncharacterized lipoprotein YajG